MYSHKELLSIQERINSDEKNLQDKNLLVKQALSAFKAQAEIRSIWKGNLLIVVPAHQDNSFDGEFEINLALLPVVLMTKFCDWLIDVTKHCADSVNNDQPKLFDHE